MGLLLEPSEAGLGVMPLSTHAAVPSSQADDNKQIGPMHTVAVSCRFIPMDSSGPSSISRGGKGFIRMDGNLSPTGSNTGTRKQVCGGAVLPTRGSNTGT